MNDPSTTETQTRAQADLVAQVRDLTARVATLEAQAAARDGEVSEEDLLVVAAACAAYLGKRAVVKQVHLRRGGAWASAGRSGIQHSHTTH